MGPFFRLLGLPVVVVVAAGRLRAGVTWRIVAIESALAAWILVAADMLFSPILVDPGTRADAALSGVPGLSLAPFRTISALLSRPSGFQAVRQIGGNIGVLLPVGLLAPALVSGLQDWRRAALLAAGVGVGVEALQMLADSTGWFDRVVDVDDSILNALGIMFGYALWRIQNSWRSRSRVAEANAEANE